MRENISSADELGRVTLDPQLRELPVDELLEIIRFQAQQIQILKSKARQRADLISELESEIREMHSAE